MNAIVMVDNLGGIGANGNLLYKVREDMMYFKQRTENKVVVMGRKTFESLPNGALSKRTNIVVTSDTRYKAEGAIVVHNYQELFKRLKRYKSEDVFIIGGASIYSQLLDECDVLYINRLQASAYDESEITAFFPHFDPVKTIGDEKWALMDRRTIIVAYHVVKTGKDDFGKLSFMVFRKRNQMLKDTTPDTAYQGLQSAT